MHQPIDLDQLAYEPWTPVIHPSTARALRDENEYLFGADAFEDEIDLTNADLEEYVYDDD